MKAARWTEDQLKAHLGRREPKPKKALEPGPRYRSQLEADYAQVLEMRRRAGEIREWGYERVRLRLPGDVFYAADFDILEIDGGVALHETKGFMREPARIKLRAAIATYPGFRWSIVGTQGGPRRMLTPDDVPSARRVVR